MSDAERPRWWWSRARREAWEDARDAEHRRLRDLAVAPRRFATAPWRQGMESGKANDDAVEYPWRTK